MAAAFAPSASSRSTSCSRVDRRVDSALILRIMAPARPVHRKDRGETAAWRAARTTSADGASLPTNAEAPASIAAKIWSSPECMVTTTSPILSSCCRMRRMMSSPVPSSSCRSVTITSGEESSYVDSAWATVPTEPTTSVSSSRANAPARPSRISSWSSTITTRRKDCWAESTAVRLFSPCCMVIGNPSRYGAASRAEGVWSVVGVDRRHADPGEPDRDHGAPRWVVRDLEIGVDERSALAHDLETVGVVTTRPEPTAVVADDDLRGRWGHPALHGDRRAAGVADGVGHRLLGDPQQLALHLGPQPGRALVEGDVDRDAAAGAQVPCQGADRGAQGVVLPDARAQRLDRPSYLADDHAQPLAEEREL